MPEDRWEAVAARWAEEMQAGRPRALPWARGGAAAAGPARRAARPGDGLDPRRRGAQPPPPQPRGRVRDRVLRGRRRRREAAPRGAAARTGRPGRGARRRGLRRRHDHRPGDGVGRRDAVRGGRGHDDRRPRSGPQAWSGCGRASARGRTTCSGGPRAKRHDRPGRLVGWLLAPALVLTVACGLAYGEAQQVLRSTANDPQEQLAGDGARALDSGAPPASLVAPGSAAASAAGPGHGGCRDGPRAVPRGLRRLGGGPGHQRLARRRRPGSAGGLSWRRRARADGTL